MYRTRSSGWIPASPEPGTFLSPRPQRLDSPQNQNGAKSKKWQASCSSRKRTCTKDDLHVVVADETMKKNEFKVSFLPVDGDGCTHRAFQQSADDAIKGDHYDKTPDTGEHPKQFGDSETHSYDGRIQTRNVFLGLLGTSTTLAQAFHTPSKSENKSRCIHPASTGAVSDRHSNRRRIFETDQNEAVPAEVIGNATPRFSIFSQDTNENLSTEDEQEGYESIWSKNFLWDGFTFVAVFIFIAFRLLLETWFDNFTMFTFGLNEGNGSLADTESQDIN